MIEKNRIKQLNNNKKDTSQQHVLYWVQKAPRVGFNQALNYSIERANAANKPLLCVFLLNDNFPYANLRNFTFLVEGLRDFSRNLDKLDISLVVLSENTDLKEFYNLIDTSVEVVTDRGYLKYYHSRLLKHKDKINVKFTQIETNLIIPVEHVSNKQEYAAYIFRPKIEKLLDEYLIPFNILSLKNNKITRKTNGVDIFSNDILSRLSLDKSIKPSKLLQGGEGAANQQLNLFIKEKLKYYSERRNDPSLDFQSNLSPYLHFGFVSPIKIVFEVKKTKLESVKDFLNEVVVWRELAHNFCHFNSSYDDFTGLPDWCKKTLLEHKNDPRDYMYSLDNLERGLTHDKYWNSAQLELVRTGKMHGYMRMYWGKKVIEWVDNPKTAYKYLIYINNKYELDGRDPNGYAGVGWCFGLHDRPWFERNIFGKVRYMAESGLKRKFNIDGYVKKVELIGNE